MAAFSAHVTFRSFSLLDSPVISFARALWRRLDGARIQIGLLLSWPGGVGWGVVVVVVGGMFYLLCEVDFLAVVLQTD